jgi:leucyl-tRNA---protein transferase
VSRLVRHWVSSPEVCAYLPSESAELEYKVLLDVDPEELEAMLARGWRRFGVSYFRPRCRHCSACVPLRIPVDHFRPSKPQRRVMKQLSALRVVHGPPQVDEVRYQLYQRWHAARAEVRGWREMDGFTEEDYFFQFAFPHPSAREYAYYLKEDPLADGGDRLLAVSLVDETPHALSAVYTFYDPAFTKWSLGTASVLWQIHRARETGRQHVYLGYRILGCASSEYKARFRPHELMTTWVEPAVAPEWTLVEARGSE